MTAVVGVVTITFLTFFMLLEGPRTIERALALLPEPTRARYERVGRDVYRTIERLRVREPPHQPGRGDRLRRSCCSQSAATTRSPSASSSAILDLIPLAGATFAAIIVSTVVLIETDWLRCLIVVVFFVGYQQFENHVLQPLVYGRTVRLSPLAVLCAVLIGAELAGILGALIAIPVAGSLLAIGTRGAPLPARVRDRDARRRRPRTRAARVSESRDRPANAGRSLWPR